MKIKALIVSVALGLSLTGCYSITLRPQGEAKLISEPTKEVSYDFFFWGIAKKYNIDVKGMCPSGLRQVQTRTTPMDSLLTLITFGIYSPRSLSVWCN